MSPRESHFRKVVQFDTDYCPSTITKYESTRTGLSSVVVDRKGPKILGYFTLATEIFDNSGAPHTLEHLVFMGSKNYRYKGLLDKLANRAYSNTNAWTATDHTAYSLDSAGWDGFAQILPVYLEHVLLPTLTDAACYTEVHHVDGTGQDAGVVYCEMQAVQNTSSSLMSLQTYRLLYPEGVGFRYETGGMMEQLRVLTTDRIREFHKEMYQPKNLCVVVIGEADHPDLLRILEQFEDSILEHFPTPMQKRPWVDSKPVPPLEKSIVETVEFPEKDESMGEISIVWLGPHCCDPIDAIALDALGTYLSGSSVSVLDKAFVEIEDPDAASVSFTTEERPNTLLSISLSSVPTKKLAEVEQRVIQVLKKTAEEPLDLPYMQDCVKRCKRQEKFYSDLSGEYIVSEIINDILYGQQDGATLRNLENLKGYEVVEKWSDEDWRSFLRKWIADAPHVSILGKPSAKLTRKMKEDEEARIAERIKTLGEKGLKELAKKLESAKAQNDIPIPEEVIGQFEVPGVESIHFIDTQSIRAGLARKGDNKIQKLLDSSSGEDSSLPLYVHLEHVPTSFVHINIILSTSKIPVELRPLLALYIDNFFDTPVMKDGKRMEYEAVVSALEKITVDYKFSSADYLELPEMLRIRIQIEPEQYASVIEWLRVLLWDSIFDKKRLTVAVSKILQDIPDEKRDGQRMTKSVVRQITQSRESIGRAQDTLTKALYYKRIAKLLETDESKVIDHLEQIRATLCQLENMRVLVIADVEKLENPAKAWKPFVEGKGRPEDVVKLDRRMERLSPIGQNPEDMCVVVPLHTIDSSFSSHIARGINRMTDPDLPALILALAYLQTVEGPLWVGVRGNGLAYGVYFTHNVSSGHLIFTIYRSPDAFKAFSAARAVVQGYMDGTTPFDPHLLEGAISAVVVQFADNASNMASAASESFISQVVHEVGRDWNSVLLKKVKEVTEEDLKRVMKKNIMGCFEKERSIVVCVAAAAKVDGIKDGFAKDGFRVEVQALEKFQDTYGLEVDRVVDGEGEGSDGGSEAGSEGDGDDDDESDED